MCQAKVGDIVAVDKKGRKFFAEVTEVSQKQKGAMIEYGVKPLVKNITYYSANSREVEAVYRRLGRG